LVGVATRKGRYRIVKFYGCNILPSNDLTSTQLIDYYNNFSRCKHYDIYDRKYCNTLIDEFDNLVKYCSQHINPKCVICEKYYVSESKGNNILCRLCVCKDNNKELLRKVCTHDNLHSCKYFNILDNKFCDNNIYGSPPQKRYCKNHLLRTCQYRLDRGNNKGIPDGSSVDSNPFIKGSDIFCRSCLKKSSVINTLKNLEY
jgi:hypothetical protein